MKALRLISNGVLFEQIKGFGGKNKLMVLTGPEVIKLFSCLTQLSIKF